MTTSSAHARLALGVRCAGLGGLLLVAVWCLAQSAAAQSQAEVDRLAEALQARPGMVLAEIGAGAGTLTVAMARKVAGDGVVFSTELDERRQADIRRAAEAAGLSNVTVIAAGTDTTNLPERCCDVVYMRDVYHHFTAAEPLIASIKRSLRPGGLLAIIDFPPRGARSSDGRRSERGGHGITRQALVEEVTAAGFELVREEESWFGRNYFVMFRMR